jgi:hypothetical protein
MSTVGIEASEGMESPAPPPSVEATVVTAKPADTVFSVLAAQARARTTTELRTTALGCAVSAGLLFWQHPALSWLASAFLAASAYGTWGLLDRALVAESVREHPDGGTLRFLRGWRKVAVVIGSGAALYTVFRFMAAALGGWQH